MSVRRRSLSADSALYHSVPQAPLAPYPTALPSFPSSSEIELAGEGAVAAADTLAPDVLVSPRVDVKIVWIHFVLGCAVLLPWNVMITATPYFRFRLTGSSMKPIFNSYLSSTFTATNFCVLAYATITSKQASSNRRTITSTVCLAFFTSLLLTSVYIGSSPGVFFYFIIFNGMAQATAGSFLQTSVIAIASLFGPVAVQAVMSGQAAVAVVVSGVQVLTSAFSVWGTPQEAISTYQSDGAAETRSASIFFGLSTLFLGFTIAAYGVLTSLPTYQAVVVPHERRKSLSHAVSSSEEREGLVSIKPHSVTDGKAEIWRIAKANLVYEVAVAYVFIVTLAVFPAITASIQTTNPHTAPLLFSAMHFFVFNVGDFLGRYVCSFPRLLIWSAKRLLTLSLARTLFIPIFLMCNVQRSTSLSLSSPIISSDFLFMFILFIFGGSNGYISSLCMMAAPSVEHNSRLKGRREDVELAATVASFCLVGGLALGSVGSFAVQAAVCDCNPFRN